MLSRKGLGSVNALFQLLHCHSFGFVEVTHTLPLNRVIQCLTHSHTMFRQLHDIFVIDLLVLDSSSMRSTIHGQARGGSTNPGQNEDIVGCFEDSLSGGGFIYVPV